MSSVDTCHNKCKEVVEIENNIHEIKVIKSSARLFLTEDTKKTSAVSEDGSMPKVLSSSGNR